MKRSIKYLIVAIVLFWGAIAIAQNMPRWAYSPSQNWQIIFVSRVNTDGPYPVADGICVSEDRTRWSLCRMETVSMEKRERLGSPLILSEQEVPFGFILASIGINAEGGISFYCGLAENVGGFYPFWDCSDIVGLSQIEDENQES